MKWFEKIWKRIKQGRMQKLRELRSELKEGEAELKRLKLEAEQHALEAEQAKLKMEIEQQIHSLKPETKRGAFVPPFSVWWIQKENSGRNLDDALEHYVKLYGLASKDDPREPEHVSIARAKLKALETTPATSFQGEEQQNFESYKMALHSISTLWLGRP